jgi:hypothetical protein
VQAAHLGLRIVELPVPLIYLEEARSFGGSLDDGRRRLQYYHRVLDTAIAAVEAHPAHKGDRALTHETAPVDEEMDAPHGSAPQQPSTTQCHCP